VDRGFYFGRPLADTLTRRADCQKPLTLWHVAGTHAKPLRAPASFISPKQAQGVGAPQLPMKAFCRGGQRKATIRAGLLLGIGIGGDGWLAWPLLFFKPTFNPTQSARKQGSVGEDSYGNHRLVGGKFI
jgi:hypothetical protein